MLNRVIQLFPLWALLLSAIAYINPDFFTPFKSAIIPLLTVIMLSMGLTLTWSDFSNVIKTPKAIMLGVLLQYLVMPLVALAIVYAFGLDDTVSLGIILVGCVAGGTASNVMCFLAKGDVALSITMTAISTLLGVLFTPFLISLYAQQLVDIPIQAMIVNLLKIVLAPVIIGLLINTLLRKQVAKIHTVLPLLSMLAIVFIIAIIVALNQAQLSSVGPVILCAVILHNGIGLLSGYWAARWCGFQEVVCRTIAFEVGLQNSGLAVALAMKFFSPAAAIAGTVFSIWHNISGSILASFWSKQALPDTTTSEQIQSTD
ncbi:bile acid:sodium symporter family protein [Pseudoalteromonas luteoviolacea]|uniref:bile acid:sodium symporter family protein n=1 Tax=Pseudoalteromonas luteoviolacea TaxID=43657 RepID=UPI001F386A30|nr:bile acid:sodium symporter family protein [Pseudoalteromonas luteoviolacea]MCF6439992.1 bile acid:sodium symporter family protein [Pseudoalteromonas luteoviolacea]